MKKRFFVILTALVLLAVLPMSALAGTEYLMLKMVFETEITESLTPLTGVVETGTTTAFDKGTKLVVFDIPEGRITLTAPDMSGNQVACYWPNVSNVDILLYAAVFCST